MEASFHVKLHWKTGSWTEVAVQFVTKASGVLTKPLGLENFESAYSSCVIHGGKTALERV